MQLLRANSANMISIVKTASVGLVWFTLAATACGQSSAEQDSSATLDEVLVTGEQSGPGLWKVSKSTADGEHVLWILGSYGPLLLPMWVFLKDSRYCRH
jgi:hypothetical protein